MNQKNENNNAKSINFEEIYHFKTKTAYKDFKILGNQSDIDKIYNESMQQGDAVRHAPIPGYEDDNCFVAITPKLIADNDVEITDVLENNGKLLIKYKEISSSAYAQDDRSNPLIILKFSGACNIKNIQLINN